MLKLWHKLGNVGNCKVEPLGERGKQKGANVDDERRGEGLRSEGKRAKTAVEPFRGEKDTEKEIKLFSWAPWQHEVKCYTTEPQPE